MNSEERRAWRVWLLLSGGRSLLFSMAFTASMIYRITVVGMSPLELVLVGTAMELAAFVFEIPTGVVADVYSRRLSILIGSVTIGLAFLLEGLVPLFGAVLLSQVIWGLGYTFTSGASEAWISDEIGEEAAAQAFVRGAQLGTVGGLLGIVVGIALASVQLNLPIVLGGALMIALAALLALWMPERGFKPLQREERSSWSAMATTLRAGIALLRQRPVLRIVLLVELVSGLYSEGFDRLWQKHILESYTLPTLRGIELQPVVWFGLFDLVGGLCAIGLTELLSRRVRLTRHSPAVRALLLLNAAIVAGMLVFSLAGGLWSGRAGAVVCGGSARGQRPGQQRLAEPERCAGDSRHNVLAERPGQRCRTDRGWATGRVHWTALAAGRAADQWPGAGLFAAAAGSLAATSAH